MSARPQRPADDRRSRSAFWAEPLLAAGVPDCLPRAGLAGLDRFPAAVQAGTLVLWAVSVVLVGPAVVELYFRGGLLPRLPGGAVLACTANAVLFGVYHLWQPQAVLTVVVTALPLAALQPRPAGRPVRPARLGGAAVPHRGRVQPARTAP